MLLTFLAFIAMILAFGSLAYFRLPMPWWTVLGVGILVVFSIFSPLPWEVLLVMAVLFLPLAVIFNWPRLRQQWIVQPIFHLLRGHLPMISRTEQEALDAGDVWWEGDLFRGAPAWRKLLAMTKPTLSVDEQAFLDNQVTTLCGMLDDWQITHELGDLPPTVWAYLREQRFFGLVIDKAYGGLGFSALAQSTIVAKIASRSVSASVVVMVPNSLGPGELIDRYGTAEQKSYYLPRLAAGEEIPCFALTAPDAGSDAAALRDRGIVCRGVFEGKEVLGMRLTWNKRYISLAPVATLLGLAFKLYDPEQLLGIEKNLGITVCLIPANHPGVIIGRRHYPLSMAFPNGTTQGNDVFVPLEWIIGGLPQVGQGWRMLMECLGIGRGVSLPAMSTAFGKLCYRATGAYARVRQQFNLPIGYFEGVQEALSRIGGFTYLLEATRLFTVSAVDQRFKPALASAIAKCHMTELGRKLMNDAMDVHGGKTIQLGPKNYLGRSYQAIPISITVEGANILTRNLMIFGQGALRCHPYLIQEIQALNQTDEIAALHAFEPLLLAHLGYVASNCARAWFYGLTGGLLICTHTARREASYYQQLTRMSTALALCTDFALLILKGDLKRRERLSARLGDVLSHLYLASAALLYYEQNGRPNEDRPCLEWALRYCLSEIQTAFDEFFTNFPNRYFAWKLRWLIFPWGRSYRKPKDVLSHAVAKQMLQPSAFRDRLSEHCYLGQGEGDPLWELDDALAKAIQAEPLFARIKRAIHEGHLPKEDDWTVQLTMAQEQQLLSSEEVATVRAALAAAQMVIAVDTFTFEQLRRTNHAEQ